jgi:hypothetical protein
VKDHDRFDSGFENHLAICLHSNQNSLDRHTSTTGSFSHPRSGALRQGAHVPVARRGGEQGSACSQSDTIVPNKFFDYPERTLASANAI